MKRALIVVTVLLAALPVVLWLTGRSAPAYVAGRRPVPAAAPSGIAHSEERTEVAGGVELFGQSWRPAAGEPKGALVIVHGLKDHGSRYGAFAEKLAARGFAVYAWDLRGHGDSSGDRVWVNSFEEYLGDLDHVLARVREREGDRPLFLFGHSMGGAISTLYTITRTPKLSGLILSAAALKRGKDVSDGVVAVTNAFASFAPGLPVFALPEDRFSRDPKVLAAMKTDPLIDQGAGPAVTARELIAALDRIQQEMASLSIPLYVMHGSEDVVTDPEGSRELVARAASKDSTLRILEGGWHDLLHEPEHAVLEAEIAAWLETRVSSVAAQ